MWVTLDNSGLLEIDKLSMGKDGIVEKYSGNRMGKARIKHILICICWIMSCLCPILSIAERSDTIVVAESVIGRGEEEIVTELREVEVTGKRQRYSKKDNPAYELMRRIRATKDLNSPTGEAAYSEDFYTKIVLGLNENDVSGISNKEKYRFLKEYVDTAVHTRKPIFLLSLRETAGTRYYDEGNNKPQTTVKAKRNVGVDDNLSPENITVALEDILRNIDIYEDDIVLMQQRFVSPIGRLADDFYHYSLNDTVFIEGKPHLELLFSPSNAESFGFNGRLFVEANDSTYFISRVEMRVPRYINLNYVDNVYITQTIRKDKFGKRHVVMDDMSLELSILPGAPGLYARRLTLNDEPEFDKVVNLPELLRDIEAHLVYENPADQPWDKWDEMRLTPLSGAEQGMGTIMSKLRRFPFIYWSEKILKTLVNGYVATGRNSKIDLGPVNTLISYNTIEGVRLRVGGLTTANLSDHWFARGYLAYGTKDKKFKYNAELEYSLTPKKYHSREFPVNSIRLHYNYDLDNIGQHYYYTNSDNVFLSLKRKSSRLSLYRREAAVTYQLELDTHFSFLGSFRHRIYEPSPWLPFINGNGIAKNRYTLAGFMVELRYAPGEKFLQTQGKRFAVNRDAPVITLTHEIVPKGMLGSEFTLNKTELSVAKRFWFSAFGYLDAIVKGGYIWSQVDYPALMWPNANLSYTIQPESYSLMNPMEFPLDHYASIDLSYFANGLIFNRIPYIKRLKLREVFTFKGLMGGLTDRNNPEKHRNLLAFPSDAHVQRLSATPYMEASVGIDNILTCLRIDYVWRLTYNHLPDVSHGGVRVSLHFSF